MGLGLGGQSLLNEPQLDSTIRPVTGPTQTKEMDLRALQSLVGRRWGMRKSRAQPWWERSALSPTLGLSSTSCSIPT